MPSRLSGPPIPRDTGWRFKPKLVLFGLVVVGLIGIVAFAAGRETAATSAPTSTRRALPTPRPALTSAEQAYLQALWPIHADVERSTMRITLAQIFYKIDDLDRPQLKTRIDEALASYRRAEARLRELQPPSSLRGAHDDYLVAVGLFDDAAVELLKTFDDGSEEHFMAAYPLSLEGSNRIREIGGRFWPDEYPPN